MDLALGIALVLVASGFGLLTLGSQVLRRKGMLESEDGLRPLRWIIWVSGAIYVCGLLLLGSAEGLAVMAAVGAGLVVLLQFVMVPIYVRDYRRATRRARAQREARARRRAADS